MAQILYNTAFMKKEAELPFDLRGYLDYIVENDIVDKCVLIVPTGKYEQKIQKDVVFKYFERWHKPCGRMNVMTLLDFGKRLLNLSLDDVAQANSKYTFISEAMQLFIFNNAINNLTDKQELDFFVSKTSASISLKVVDKLKSIILGLKEDGITPDSMWAECTVVQGVTSAERRFRDVQKIYIEYENILSNKDFLDAPSVYNTLAKSEISKFSVREVFPDCQFIMLTGFSEFKLPEVEFLRQFSEIEIPLVINVDFSNITGPFIEYLPENVRRLRRFGEMKKYSADETKVDVRSVSEHISRWLFNPATRLYKPELLEQIKVVALDNKVAEVEYLAKLVRYLVANEGMKLSDICICMRQPQDYSDLFREIFSENGITINVSDRFGLSEASPILFLFLLLKIANTWELSDIKKLLLFDIGKGKDFANILDCLVKVSKEHRIIGGRNSGFIENILKNYLDYYERKNEVNAGLDEYEKKDIERQIKEIKYAIKAVEQLKALLPSKEQSTISDFVGKLFEIIEKTKLYEHLIDSYVSYMPEIANNRRIISLSNFQLLEEVEKGGQALSAFIAVLNEWMEYDGDSGRRYSLKELCNMLETLVAGGRYQISEKLNLGVKITDIEQSRGLQFKVMLLCGAVDGVFPQMFKTDTFLGKELPESEERHQDGERILFYQFLTNNKELLDAGKMKIYITYPTKEDDTPLIRSHFINELFSIITEDGTLDERIYKVEIGMCSDLEETIYTTDISSLAFDKLLKGEDNTLLEKIIDIQEEQNGKNTNKHSTTSEERTERTMKLQEFLGEKEYSVTELEEYLLCPYKYFLSKIVKLEEEMDYAEDSLNPLEIGNYLHKILETFYIRGKKESGKECYDVDTNAAFDEYIEILNGIMDDYVRELDFPMFKYDKERLRNRLRYWLQAEIEKRKGGWKWNSTNFEFKFGGKDIYGNKILPSLLTNEVGNIKLQGKIDRIEQDETHFVISDYKLSGSSIKSFNKIRNGEALQIPLYMMALKNIPNYVYKDLEAMGGLYYDMNPSDGKLVNWGIKEKEEEDGKNRYAVERDELNDILRKSVDIAIEQKEQINGLQFPMNAGNERKNCMYCNFKKICKQRNEKSN